MTGAFSFLVSGIFYVSVSCCWRRFTHTSLSHFHAREICVWTSLIQANTHSHSQTHTHTQTFIGLLIPWCVHSCQISAAVRLLCWAYVTEDQRQTACLFFSVSAVPVPPSHWAPLSHHWYNDYFSLLSLSLIQSRSAFNIQTYHKTSDSPRVCLLHRFTNIDRLKPRLQCDKISCNHIYF